MLVTLGMWCPDQAPPERRPNVSLLMHSETSPASTYSKHSARVLFLVLPMTAASKFNLMLVFMRCDCEHWGVASSWPSAATQAQPRRVSIFLLALNSYTGSLPIT